MKSKIKTMKLYNNANRIYNEINELGKKKYDKLNVNDLCNYDQLHYHGTNALDFTINKLKINSKMSILEIGSGIGGPSRYIANKTGAKVTAIELQLDQNKLALDLTKRCGLNNLVKHICGNFLCYNWKEEKFDAIVSWLTLYHIKENNILLQKCYNLLKTDGFFYTEDLLSKKKFNKKELLELEKEIFANYLTDYNNYIKNLKINGFKSIIHYEMSNSWTKFTKKRINSFIQNRNRHLRVHGEEIVDDLISFYSFIDKYFSKGKLGGIRIIAKK